MFIITLCYELWLNHSRCALHLYLRFLLISLIFSLQFYSHFEVQCSFPLFKNYHLLLVEFVIFCLHDRISTLSDRRNQSFNSFRGKRMKWIFFLYFTLIFSREKSELATHKKWKHHNCSMSIPSELYFWFGS